MTGLDRAAEVLRRATTITAMTGAGVSAGSGVPTFRGAGGLWKTFRPETLATPEAFANDPRLVWEWYDWRRGVIAGASPNDAHHVLARWSRELAGLTLITQNVDGLHERAGSVDVVRLHGSIWHVRCADGCAGGRAGWRDDRVPLPELPPRCPHCSGYLRPAVVWFGESLNRDDVARAAAVSKCDVFLTIGTSSIVYPAAGFVDLARRHGATTIEINPEATDATARVDIAVAAAAEIALPEIARRL